MTIQQNFTHFAKEHNVLQTGEFTLKSGRVSPYFYNSGLFNTGASIAQLADFYAITIIASGVEFDMLFGPAYKGIPLVSAVAASLHRIHGINAPWAFNRKEPKDHGEGGMFVGAPIKGDVLIIDDVITKGTAIRESIPMIEQADTSARVVGVCVSLDRQERGAGELSTTQEISEEFGIETLSIIGFADIFEYIQQQIDDPTLMSALTDYQSKYGSVLEPNK